MIELRTMRRVENVARIVDNSHTAFVEKPEGKRRLRKPRCRFEDNIKTELTEIE
jgi:hypothetical protein